MLQTQATERTPTPTTTTAPAASGSAAASNQAQLAATGLGASAPPEAGSDLFTTLPLLGDLAAVVLSAMPAESALPLAVAFKAHPFVYEWLRSLDPDELLALAVADAEAFVDLVITPGTTLEATFEGTFALACGVALGGAWRLGYENPHAARVGYEGEVGGLAAAGVGGAVGYEGGDRTGASAGVEASGAVGAQIEWTVDPVAWVAADVHTLQALLAGHLPDAGVLAAQVEMLQPTTLIAEVEAGLAGEAGVGGAHVEVDVLGDTPVLEASAGGLAAEVVQGGVNLVGALFSGAFAELRGGATVACGFDGEGPLASVELSRTAAASFYGLDGKDELGVRIEVRPGEPSPASGGDAPIRGTLELSAANDEDRHTTRVSWDGIVELENLQGSLEAPEGGTADPERQGPGELLVAREHRVEDPSVIEDLLDGTPVAAGLVRLLVGHAEVRYDAEVVVRMGEDTTSAFSGPPPENEEQARDRQRQLAAMVLGESFATEAPVYAAGVQDCARVEAATITLTAEVGGAIGGELGALAKGEGSIAAAAAYKRETDLGTNVPVQDVARLLRA